MKNQIQHLVNSNIQNLASKASPSRSINTIRLDKGELPYPPSSRVIQAIADAAQDINRYPEMMGGNLRQNLAQYIGKKPEQIIIGNGSDDLIELIIKVFTQPAEEVLLPVPTFFIYEFAAKVCGALPVWVHRTDNFDLDIEATLAKITPQTKIIFIANPNNPTANLINQHSIIEILEKVNCIVVIDECYYEFCQETIIDLIDQYPNLIVLRSLSKSFGLAGLRVGYAIADETTVDYLYRAAQLFPVNKLAIAAANSALEDLDYVAANIQKIEQQKLYLACEMQKLGLIVYPSATNFLFVGTKSIGLTSSEIVKSLQQDNILIADFGLKQGLSAYYFRTAIGTEEENKKLLTALQNLVPI